MSSGKSYAVARSFSVPGQAIHKIQRATGMPNGKVQEGMASLRLRFRVPGQRLRFHVLGLGLQRIIS